MGVSLRQCAAALARDYSIKLSHEAIRRGLKRGILKAERDGTLDPAKIAAQWERNAHPGQGKSNGNGAVEGYAQARAATMVFEARIREMEFRKLAGELVESERVRMSAFDETRRARNLLLTIPARLAPVLAGVTDPDQCRKIIEKEINAVLDELADDDRDR